MTALTTAMITVTIMILSVVVMMMMIGFIMIDIISYYFVNMPAIVKIYLL